MNRVASLHAAVLVAFLGMASISANASEPVDLETIQKHPFQPRGDLDPKDYRLVSQWVNDLPRKNMDFGTFARRALQLKQDNPQLNDEEIADRLTRDFPGLSSADGLEQLQQWVRQFQPAQLDLSRMIPSPPATRPEGDRPFPAFPPMFPPMGTDRRLPPDRGPMFPGTFPDPNDESGIFPNDIPSSIDQQDAEMVLRRQRQYLAIKQFWERNFGSLEKSPALRQLLLDMFVGADPMNSATGDGLSALLGDEEIDPNKLLNWLEGRIDLADLQLGDIKFFDFELPSLSTDDFRSDSISARDMAVTGSLFDEAELIIIVVGVVGVVAALWFSFGRSRSTRSAKRIPGPEEWPIDPRTIADRAGVVTAFEFLSLRVCGIPARSWNHEQIAEAFRQQLGADPTMSPVNALVALYVVARYAPVADPFTPSMIAEAREHLCTLAGVPIS